MQYGEFRFLMLQESASGARMRRKRMLAQAFKRLKGNLELTETFDGLIQQRHNAVRRAIKNIDVSLETKLIGSLQRQTRIHPRPEEQFDIDILVILGRFNKWVQTGGVTPDDALNRTGKLLAESERYISMNPVVDHPTVTFEYKDSIKVELVAAYIDDIGQSPNGAQHVPISRGYWVPKYGQWELVDYDHDADQLSRLNTECDGMLVPTIKMLKALKRIYFPQLGSFHLECLAAKVIPERIRLMKNLGMPVTYPDLITGFFAVAGGLLHSGVRIIGSNGPHIVLPAAEVRPVSDKFDQIANFCTAISMQQDEKDRVDKWRDLFGTLIPQDIYA